MLRGSCARILGFGEGSGLPATGPGTGAATFPGLRIRYPQGLCLKEEKDEQSALEEEEEQDYQDFCFARAGDHLICPFQCNLCHFRNVTGADPNKGMVGDVLLLVDIRRANLDAFWARRKGTVQSNLLEMKRLLRAGRDRYGRVMLFPSTLLRGPLPADDSWGMQVACAMLSRSLEPGNNSRTVQFVHAVGGDEPGSDNRVGRQVSAAFHPEADHSLVF
jgi:hypothetical protein